VCLCACLSVCTYIMYCSHDTKPLATRPLPITLSPPDPSTPIDVNERCAAHGYLRTEQDDTEVLRSYPSAPASSRPGEICKSSTCLAYYAFAINP
jgi:hypothetical protein